jgi:hypothetical protein
MRPVSPLDADAPPLPDVAPPLADDAPPLADDAPPEPLALVPPLPAPPAPVLPPDALPEQPLRSGLHVSRHRVMVPFGCVPIVALEQVAVPRLVPSHSSPDSRTLLPQVPPSDFSPPPPLSDEHALANTSAQPKMPGAHFQLRMARMMPLDHAAARALPRFAKNYGGKGTEANL